MRVVELHAGPGAFVQSAPAHADEQWRFGAFAQTTIGGYLVLRRQSTRRRLRSRLAPLFTLGHAAVRRVGIGHATVRRIATERAAVRRAQMCGVMGMAIVSAFALLTVGDPADCHNCDKSMARLAYAKELPIVLPPGVSLISTSAIKVSALPPRQLERRASLLPAKITPLTEAAPPRIRLASALPIPGASTRAPGNATVLTALDVAMPDLAEIVAVDSGSGTKVAGYVATTDEPRPTHHRQPRRLSKHHSVSSASPSGRRAPRWARQMYDTNWQGTTFSYVR